MNTNILSEPLFLPCGAVLPNRIVKSSMTEGMADRDNNPTDAHARLYRRWAAGGVGLSLTGNVMVDRVHLERPGNISIISRTPHPKLIAMAAAGTSNGGHCWMQIGHAGRQTPKYVNGSPKTASASHLKIAGQFGKAVAYSDKEIRKVVDSFANAAAVAKHSGFTGVQIHAAHGFLLSQFLSPLLNKRDDKWGGSLRNRARLLLDVIDSVRNAVGPNFPVSVKLNSEDFQKGGFTLSECLSVVEWLNDKKIDLLEVTGGSYETPKMIGCKRVSGKSFQTISDRTEKREAYFLSYAKIIRQVAKMPILVTGGFRSAFGMKSAIENGDTDLIGIARPLVTDPELPKKLFEDSINELPCYEHSLRWKPDHFGPNSKFFIFRLINIQGQQGWFYQQISRMGRGLNPALNMGLLKGLLSYLINERIAAFKLSNRKKYIRSVMGDRCVEEKIL